MASQGRAEVLTVHKGVLTGRRAGRLQAGWTTSSEEGSALRGARQGVGQSSVNKTEGRAGRVTQEQSSVKGRVELKAMADFVFFLHPFIFTLFYSA